MSKMLNRYKLLENGVKRSDGACIPDDDGNRDWQEYQEWLSIGNTPDPMDLPPEPTVDELRKKDILEVWPIHMQLEALTEAASGRIQKRDELLAYIESVKIKYPKV